jgi:hypothetical protein
MSLFRAVAIKSLNFKSGPLVGPQPVHSIISYITSEYLQRFTTSGFFVSRFLLAIQ